MAQGRVTRDELTEKDLFSEIGRSAKEVDGIKKFQVSV